MSRRQFLRFGRLPVAAKRGDDVKERIRRARSTAGRRPSLAIR
jgi:hypothetical protein